jgi:hydroxypyruvate isomerase
MPGSRSMTADARATAEGRSWALRYAPSLNVVAIDVPLDRRLRMYADQGLTAAEYSCAGQPNCGLLRKTPAEVSALRANAERHGLEMGVFVANPGNASGAGLCDPRERAAFLSELARAVEYHKLLGNRSCTVLVGPQADGLSRAAQRASVVEGLKRAAELVARLDLTWVVEPVNRIDAPRYFLSDSDEAAEIVTLVGSDRVKMLFDVYHQGMSGENVAGQIARHHPCIGYYQLGDAPGRREPGSGTLDWIAILRAIRATGYAGPVGLEHWLSASGEVGLANCLAAYRDIDARVAETLP